MPVPDGLTIRPGVAAVVRDSAGHVLLHLRRTGGGWAPPSGSVEPGESLRATLDRELTEETGLTVQDVRLVGLYSEPAFMIVTYPDGRVIQYVTALFHCRAAGGTFAGNAEGLQWAWFPPDALPAALTPYARVWLADALSGADDVAIR